jgi:hypothetical protein
MLARRDVLAGIAALPLAGSAFADTALITQSSWDALTKRGLYLPILHEPRGIKAAALQFQAQLFALVGDEDRAFRTMAVLDNDIGAPLNLTDNRATGALDAIAHAAKDRQIVILNEAHHISRCRAFALDVALLLRAQGFEVFAAEAFNNDGAPDVAQSLNSGGPVTANFGIYPDDPVYAELLRQARAAGYRFAAYEARYDQVLGESGDARTEARENAQADNFMANILDTSPHARVFVYCGYDHARKTPQNGIAWFAARLKAKTGIDPLCITQSAGVPPPNPVLENAALKSVLDRFNPTQPIVVSDGDGRPVVVSQTLDHGPAPFDGSIDLSVFHPRLPYVAGRPGWLAKAAGRKALAYRFAMPTTADGLAQAVPAAEAATVNAVPSDQFPVPEGTREVTFFVGPGDYEIRLETDAGRHAVGTLMGNRF